MSVQKGDIRNTVLRQVKQLEKSIQLLEQSAKVKKEETKELSDKKPSTVKWL